VAGTTGCTLFHFLHGGGVSFIRVNRHMAVLATQPRCMGRMRKKSLIFGFFCSHNKVVFEGCNVHIRNGFGATNTNNSFGNLIIGYNLADARDVKDGSHNIVVGDFHTYSSFGGVVFGHDNRALGPYATVLGGHNNKAIGEFSLTSSA
jgi:hypothetical protein